MREVLPKAELHVPTAGRGASGVPGANKIFGQISCSEVSLPPPFCAFSFLDGPSLLSQA